ncbi:MAG TPA: glutamine--fructose-6-phosphate transaminase (isomerizing) [Gammaproteobacteria bacterium]|nr:glutamine--fructose-6-phosphate transaminase (isomerizing) [Gammaproteobacteria bacterium]
MCGIVGAVSERNIERILIKGLKRLEYRGYDSAGLAVIDSTHHLLRLRTLGKVSALEQALQSSDLHGTTGIAHTRWATHGVPSEHNAHPLVSHDQFALVHNGIIENHEPLRKKLLDAGYTFSSETDSETVVHLLHFHYQKTQDFLKATQKTVQELEGAYALGIVSSLYPNELIAVRHGSPLVIGHGIVENFFASDPLALSPMTKQFIYLEDGDIARITCHDMEIFDADLKPVERKMHNLELNFDATDRGEHRHYMSKEIFEQPLAITDHLDGRTTKTAILDSAFGMQTKALFKEVQHVQLVACGTSYHAAMVARYWIEALAGIPCAVEVASEYRYRKMVVPKNSLFVTLSQSGETADTLAALRLAKKMGFLGSLAICNVPESSLVRESDFHFMTRAGAEIGVASTKAFTTQLTALLLFTIALGRQHHLPPDVEKNLANELSLLANTVKTTLKLNDTIARLAHRFIDKHHALFLGRGALYPIALEGALKLKEISYIHAEGYPAGELKHGPLALVDKNMPVIALAPGNELIEKVKSNLQEVRTRGGELFIFTDSAVGLDPAENGVHLIGMPTVDPILAPIVYTIPMQLLAYHVAVLKGTDVDQPRNLAKSVTVE